MTINHVVGNNKIFFIKKTAKLLSFIVLLILSFFLKINRKNSDLIISTAFYAPWKDNKDFTSIEKEIKKKKTTREVEKKVIKNLSKVFGFKIK